ncbi:MAG: DUF1376 domain-containing protein, partial [Acidiferrobacteraceae bacterium]
MTAWPEPLVSVEVDLRSLPYMPVFFEKLLKSDTWIRAAQIPYLGHVLMNLWGSSWTQIPAGSLPNDDIVLAMLAMRTLPQWRKIKDAALAGWILCADERWYHPVIAKIALDSWRKMETSRARSRLGNETRWGRHARSIGTNGLPRESDPREGTQSDSGGSTPAADEAQTPLFNDPPAEQVGVVRNDPPQTNGSADTRCAYYEEFMELWTGYPR